MVCSALKFGMGRNFPFLVKDDSILSKTGPKQTFDFNTLSERPISKLSENQEINVIGLTELKLWPFKKKIIRVLELPL